ncbi:hypothetical protein GCM10023189_49040 [Nibrella saemangeumensis]|uniref:Uncharacterized protein n=1 Tax=Nibrella saemangeumensis TaxID=1084526 RepID=A0ABP8NIZ6_9BACT
MLPTVPQRNILEWFRPSVAERYEIFQNFGPELGPFPRGVLTINGPLSATLETRYGTYTIQRQSLFTNLFVMDTAGALVAEVRTGWWGKRRMVFSDGREFHFSASNVVRSRWLWSNAEGEPRAMVKQNQIFFSPDWPVKEGMSSLMAGMTIYFMLTRPSFFSMFS